MDDATALRCQDVFTLLLAGGKGSRLHELTQEECKPALHFAGGTRIVDFALANAQASGLRQVMVATQYKPAGLTAYLQSRWSRAFPQGLALREGHQVTGTTEGYRGTADAVRANLPEIDMARPQGLLVLSADHVYQMDFAPMIARHHWSGARITVAAMTVPKAQAHNFGVLEADANGEILSFAEKPDHPAALPDAPSLCLVSMGIYFIDWVWLREILLHGPTGAIADCDFGQHILPAAVAQGVAHVWRPEADGQEPYWRDVGTLDAYRLAQLDFAPGKRQPFGLPQERAPNGVVQPGAQVSETVLMPGAKALPGARVRRVIAAPGAVLPGDLVVGEDPEEDRRWFRVTENGTTLVTPAMLCRRATARTRVLPVLHHQHQES